MLEAISRIFVLLSFVFTGHVRAQDVDTKAAVDPLPPAFRAAVRTGGTGFPLVAGYRWVYAVRYFGELSPAFVEMRSGRLIGERGCVDVSSRGDAFLFFGCGHLTSPSGRLEYRFDEAEGFLEPLVVLESELRPGRTWVSRSTRAGGEVLSFRATVLRRESVSVAAGKFDAWVVEYELDFGPDSTQHARAWFAPGVGFVKMEWWARPKREREGPAAERQFRELIRIEESAIAHRIDRYPSKPIRVSELPGRLRAPDGKLSLVADFEDRLFGITVLYIVNRTRELVLVPSQDEDVYAKLETRDADGQWRRAQSHVSSWCGNSYFDRKLPPGHFIAVLGWSPSKGEERDVRYRLYDELDLVSNVGKGIVDLDEVVTAHYDPLAIHRADTALLESILFRDLGLSCQEKHRSTTAAFLRLMRLPADDALPIVERWLELHAGQARKDDEDPESSVADLLGLAGLSLAKLSPARFTRFVAESLDGDDSTRRSRVFEVLGSLDDSGAEEIRALLEKEALEPSTPDLRAALSFLAGSKLPKYEGLLARVADDPRYLDSLRIAARWERERAYGDGRVVAKLDRTGPDRELDPALRPVELLIRIRNATDRVIDFRYTDPSEIVALYVETERPHPPNGASFIPVRVGVEWLARSRSPGETAVRLASGREHAIRMRLLDYFDLPVDHDPRRDHYRIWASCAIPGVHRVADPSGSLRFRIAGPPPRQDAGAPRD